MVVENVTFNEANMRTQYTHNQLHGQLVQHAFTQRTVEETVTAV